MFVTVVVAALDEHDAIGKLLQSLEGQSRKPDQVLIADGGSKDGTLERIAALSPTLSFEVSVLDVPGKIAAGRNRAIAQAQGQIIAVTDADCVPVENWLRLLISPLEDGDASAVAGGYFAEASNALERAIATFSWVPLNRESQDFLPSHRSVAFKKSAWEAVGGYREDIDSGEDTRFDIDIRKKFGFANAVGANVAWRPRNSIRKTMWQQLFYGAGDGQARNLLLYHAGIAAFVAGELALACPVGMVRAVAGSGLALALVYFLVKHYRLFHRIFPDVAYVALLLAILPACRLVGFALGLFGISVRTISKRS